MGDNNTLMEAIYADLTKFDLVESAEEYSMNWCGRSKSWFAVLKNKGGDLSVAVAITLLNHAKVKKTILILKRNKLGSFLNTEIDLLNDIIARINGYLLQTHSILEVAETATKTSVTGQGKGE